MYFVPHVVPALLVFQLLNLVCLLVQGTDLQHHTANIKAQSITCIEKRKGSTTDFDQPTRLFSCIVGGVLQWRDVQRGT